MPYFLVPSLNGTNDGLNKFTHQPPVTICMSELCPLYQTQNLPKLDFILADQSVMLSNWWDNHSSGQKVPTCGLCYFVIFVDLMADTPLEAANVLLAVGLFQLAVIVLVTGELFVSILILIFILNQMRKSSQTNLPNNPVLKKLVSKNVL